MNRTEPHRTADSSVPRANLERTKSAPEANQERTVTEPDRRYLSFFMTGTVLAFL